MNEQEPPSDAINVRQMAPSDLGAMISLDARHTGRRREEFLKLKVAEALHDTGIQVSLVAEVDGLVVGFLLSRVYYGEFGAIEPAAVLETLAVNPDFRRRGIGAALFAQLRTNLGSLGVPTLQTEVSWDDQDLLGFFHDLGFMPASRFCLDLDITGR